jgi:hypothetical protein
MLAIVPLFLLTSQYGQDQGIKQQFWHLWGDEMVWLKEEHKLKVFIRSLEHIWT